VALHLRRRRLGIDHRDESSEEPRLGVLADATAIFFTGGDQLRITTVWEARRSPNASKTDKGRLLRESSFA
jgi:cyanophycinase-like exopeptidase